jgi:predicted  nucleic acid-binding Zn-ribbon protein
MTYASGMSEAQPEPSLREYIAERGEELLGKLAQELLDSPTVNSAIGRALAARSKATEAQQLAMGLLNLPTAGDLERLTRRVRSVSQRLEAIEDALARIEDGVRQPSAPLAARLEAIEAELTAATRALTELRSAMPDAPGAVSRDQERLRVEDALLSAKGGKSKRPKRAD